MAKMNKSQWQKAAKGLGIEYQSNDTVASLVERIALEVGISKGKKSDTELRNAVISKLAKPATPSPAPKKEKKKKKKGIPFSKIVAERGINVCLEIKGQQYWFPADKVKINKSAKTVEMPKWLKDLKIK